MQTNRGTNFDCATAFEGRYFTSEPLHAQRDSLLFSDWSAHEAHAMRIARFVFTPLRARSRQIVDGPTSSFFAQRAKRTVGNEEWRTAVYKRADVTVRTSAR